MPNPFRPGTAREQIDEETRRRHAAASDPPGATLDAMDAWEETAKRAKQITAIAGAVKLVWGLAGMVFAAIVAAVVWGTTRASVAYVDERARAVANADQAVAEHLQAEIAAINESRAATLEALKAQREAIEKVGEQVKELRGYLIRPGPASEPPRRSPWIGK